MFASAAGRLASSAAVYAKKFGKLPARFLRLRLASIRKARTLSRLKSCQQFSTRYCRVVLRMGPAPGIAGVMDARLYRIVTRFQFLPRHTAHAQTSTELSLSRSAPNCKSLSRCIASILMDLPPHGHDPVLLGEVLQLLDPKPGQIVIDCTIGRGGHAWEIAQRLSTQGTLIGIDADPENLEFARNRLASAHCAIRLFHANFSELADVMSVAQIVGADAILADLGLSTNQLLCSRLGFSFANNMPLDMRIDPRLDQTAAEIVNKMPEKALANVLYELAQERYSRQIARKLAQARSNSPNTTTERLAELVRSAIPRRRRPRGAPAEKIDPATRTFLALRMKVNREMENLAALLEQAPGFLKKGGRLAVISFQSMEDRAVKQAFRSAEQTGQLKILTKKPITPTEAELAANPRARSAKLRVAEKN